MDKAKIQHEIKQKKRIVTVIGTIEDVRILGEGGNGLVYKGKLYGIDVAVKLLVNTDHKKRERFLAEYFNIQATCDSKHISKNLEYDEIDILGEKVPCIIMKLYEKTLKNFRNEEPRTADNVIRLFEHLCEALEVIHAKKIIHRDIKPENIFVDGMDFVLADYGLAKYSTEQFELADMSRADERLGNCTYSAPEQIEKPYRAATEASDIYAMAQVIYWYVTGKTFRAIPHNSSAALAMPFLPSASCRNLDLPPVNLRFLQSHLTKNAFAIAPTHLCGIALGEFHYKKLQI